MNKRPGLSAFNSQTRNSGFSLPVKARRLSGLFLMLAVQSNLSRAADFPICDYSADLSSAQSVVIDANSGAIRSGRTSFPDGKQVRLVFVHKNPFNYEYAYDIKGVLVDPRIIKGALEKLGILATDSGKGPEATPLSDARIARTCTAVDDSVRKSIDEITRERRQHATQLQEIITHLDINAAKYDAIVETIHAAIPTTVGSCIELRDSGFKLQSAIKIIRTGRETVAVTFSDLKKLDEKLDLQIRPAAVTAMTIAGASCERLLGEFRNLEEALKSNVAAAGNATRKFNEKNGQIQTMADVVDDVLSDPDSFMEVRPIGPVSEATDYDVTIVRTDRRNDDDKTTFKVADKLRLGRARFSYSVGAAFGFSDQRTFGRIPSVLGTGEIGNVVGITDESNSQVGVVAQLNTRISGLSKTNNSSWGWSLGAVLSQGTDKAQFGLYTGPYFTIGRRMFITAAYHIIDEMMLAGGFELGDTVPDELQGDVPTSTRRTGALLITLTFDYQ